MLFPKVRAPATSTSMLCSALVELSQEVQAHIEYSHKETMCWKEVFSKRTDEMLKHQDHLFRRACHSNVNTCVHQHQVGSGLFEVKGMCNAPHVQELRVLWKLHMSAIVSRVDVSVFMKVFLLHFDAWSYDFFILEIGDIIGSFLYWFHLLLRYNERFFY